ncbi:MAG: Uma2 family endonuclease [Vicinamibacterales bacterium]
MEGDKAMPTASQRDARLTYEDFCRIPDDGMRHEIIDGVHYVTPSPVRGHQLLLGRLHLAIGRFLEDHPEVGQVYLSPLDTVFSPWDVVEPDLLFVAADQLDILTEPNIQGAPALVIEILSPSTRKRDLGIKRQLFDRGGVREYWIVDPKALDLTVYQRAVDGTFPKVAQLSAGDHATLTTPLLPGFTLSLTRLFA